MSWEEEGKVTVLAVDNIFNTLSTAFSTTCMSPSPLNFLFIMVYSSGYCKGSGYDNYRGQRYTHKKTVINIYTGHAQLYKMSKVKWSP